MSERPSTIAIYVVVLSRALYAGIVSIGIVYFAGIHVLGWTININQFPPTGNILWIPLFVTVCFIVIGVGFWLWVALSWGTAYVLCPSVRNLELE